MSSLKGEKNPAFAAGRDGRSGLIFIKLQIWAKKEPAMPCRRGVALLESGRGAGQTSCYAGPRGAGRAVPGGARKMAGCSSFTFGGIPRTVQF